MTEKLIKSLLNSPTINKQKTKKVLAIGEIENNTEQNIDIEMIVSEIINLLNESGKFEVVNAGQNAKIEQIIRYSRKFRNDNEYNQYTTIEQGNLISPHYALTGKIIERNKTINDDEIKEYLFSLTLTDLKLGAVRWVSTERISKKLPKEEVAKSSSYNYNSSSYSYNQSYSYSNDNDSDSWEGVKEFFSFGADGRNHFTLGVDFGILNYGGDINIVPIDFSIIEQSTDYRGNITTKTTAHSVYASDLSVLSFPITARVGYLRDIGDNWAFGVNFIYNYVALFDNYLTTSATTKLQSTKFTLQRIGGEAEIYYKFKDIPQHWGGGDIYMYLGGGAMKDLGSKVKVTLEAYRSGYYSSSDESINQIGQKRLNIERKIDSWYPIVKLGLIWYFNDYIGLSYELNYSWALSETDVVSTGFGWGVLGLRVKI